jgi:hypothetical protein
MFDTLMKFPELKESRMRSSTELAVLIVSWLHADDVLRKNRSVEKDSLRNFINKR